MKAITFSAIFVLAVFIISAYDFGTNKTELENRARIEKLEEIYTPTLIGFMGFSNKSQSITGTGGEDVVTNGGHTLFDQTYGVGDVRVGGDSIVIDCECHITGIVTTSITGGLLANYRLKVMVNGTPMSGVGAQMNAISATNTGTFMFAFKAENGDVIKASFEEVAGLTNPVFLAGSVLVFRV